MVGDGLNVSGVFVTTDDTAGASSARGFHLIVDCGTTGSPARVVGPRGGSDGLDNRS